MDVRFFFQRQSNAHCQWCVMGSHNGMSVGHSQVSTSVSSVTGVGSGSDTRLASLKTAIEERVLGRTWLLSISLKWSPKHGVCGIWWVWLTNSQYSLSLSLPVPSGKPLPLGQHSATLSNHKIALPCFLAGYPPKNMRNHHSDTSSSPVLSAFKG